MLLSMYSGRVRVDLTGHFDTRTGLKIPKMENLGEIGYKL